MSDALQVTVYSRPGHTEPISPAGLTLTDSIHEVVWECDDLPEGATLLIHFLEDPRGPFAHLVIKGKRVTGYGNRGPNDTALTYHYEAKVAIGGLVSTVGDGMVQNNADDVVTYDPAPGPPWDNVLGGA
jgi:hypothetical protein